MYSHFTVEIDTTVNRSKPENMLFGQKPRLYVCSGDGLGSTGKTAIQNSLRSNLRILLPDTSVGFFKEPPYEELEGNSPYEITTKGLIAKEALGPFLAATRGEMWSSKSKTPWKVPNDPIIIGDRSPAASFLQGAYPSGDNPWGNQFWKLFYGQIDWVPFPDILPLLFPDDINKQIDRLKKRISIDSVPDQFDDPDKQIKQFEGFKALSDILLKFPGVYKVTTGEIKNTVFGRIRSVDPGFVLSLLTVSLAVEKGVVSGISKGYFIQRIGRVEGNNLVTSYFIDLEDSGLFLEDSFEGFRKTEEVNSVTARFGDIGILWPQIRDAHKSPFVAVVYALEGVAKKMETREVHEYIFDSINKHQIVDIQKEIRYGNDLFKLRFPDIQRAWGNITW